MLQIDLRAYLRKMVPRFHVGFILIATVIVCVWFLQPAPSEFPMDDAYIHFVYAENLAENGVLAFNDPTETGVGASSPLWLLLLAAGHAAGVSVYTTARVLGIVALATVGFTLYQLLRRLEWGTTFAFIATLLVTLSGNFVWFALSGMETMLFVAVGMSTLLIYRQRHWGRLSVALGLLTLVRPEGMLLGLAIAGVEIWRWRRIRPELFWSGVGALSICGPWFAYLFWRTGYPLPTSAVGKQMSYDYAIQLLTTRSEIMALVGRTPGLLFLGQWAGYALAFVLGGAALPAPRLPLALSAGSPEYAISLWAIAGCLGIVAPLLFAAVRRMARPSRLVQWRDDPDYRPFLALLLWLILHNIAYIICLPNIGTASRYVALNHVALWLALSLGFVTVVRHPQQRRRRYWFAGGLGLLAIANLVYWNGVYAANLDHMINVRIEAAHYMRSNLAPNKTCAAFDVGALRYHSQAPLVDLGGLIDPDAGQEFLAGHTDEFIVEHGATCLIIPGRTNSPDEGWIDFVNIMGLNESSLFQLRQIAVYEIDRERWLQGYLPTNNYQASVTIYELQAYEVVDRTD